MERMTREMIALALAIVAMIFSGIGLGISISGLYLAWKMLSRKKRKDGGDCGG